MPAVGDDNFLGKTLDAVKESTEALLVTCKDIGL
jgi:hypothetical protein